VVKFKTKLNTVNHNFRVRRDAASSG